MTRNETVDAPAPPPAAVPRRGRSHLIFLGVILLLGAVAIKVVVFPDFLSWGPRYSMDSQEVFASYMRSLGVTWHEPDEQIAQDMANIHSTDPAAVRAWLEGRLGFAVPVADLSDARFVLVGGRLDFMHNRPVAAVVYRRQGRIINVFIWPGKSDETTLARDGIQFVHWNSGDLTIWAISDLGTDEMEQFVAAFRGRSNLK
jgi:hypothetical protein